MPADVRRRKRAGRAAAVRGCCSSVHDRQVSAVRYGLGDLAAGMTRQVVFVWEGSADAVGDGFAGGGRTRREATGGASVEASARKWRGKPDGAFAAIAFTRPVDFFGRTAESLPAARPWPASPTSRPGVCQSGVITTTSSRSVQRRRSFLSGLMRTPWSGTAVVRSWRR